MNYWYVARENEILIDADGWAHCRNHVRARLQGAIECGNLKVSNVEIHSSWSKTHAHILITLDGPLDAISRAVWAVILHSDLYRGCSVLMRVLHKVRAPDLLITPSLFAREPDTFCGCVGKHTAKVMESCIAAKILRGKFRAQGFFGKPSKNPCKFLD